MTPNAIYSKSGKGVQEASGKTSLLGRAERAALSAFDGRLTVSEVADRIGKPFDAKFQQLVIQLERDGFIREVSAGAATAATTRPGVAPARAAPAAGKPAGKPAGGSGEDLDFTISMPAAPPPKAAPPPPPKVDAATQARQEADKSKQEDNMTRARREAEERQHKERDRVKAETEAKLRAETEVKMRSEAAAKAKADAEKAKADAEAKVRAEAEAKVQAAREAAVRAAFEAERKAKEEVERVRKEAEEKARKEAAEIQRKLDEERRAREEAERRAKEEAERARREAEEKARREAAELQRKLDEERKAREEAERARKEAERQAQAAAERARQEAEERRKEEERHAREAQERAGKEAQRQAREETERAEREAEAAAQELERLVQVVNAATEKEQEKPAPAKAVAGAGFADSLLADLESFTQREDEDRKAKEEAEKAEKAKKEADRQAREEKAREEREAEERKANEEGERKKREAQERKEREEKERREREAREEEERVAREAEERKQRARAVVAAKEEKKGSDDDIGVSDEDLDMDDVKADEAAVSKSSRKQQREREREAKERAREARLHEKEAKRAQAAPPPGAAPSAYVRRTRRSWGKPIALLLFLVLVVGVGVLHIMPISTAEYEKVASEALGRQVKIGAARFSLVNGVQLKFEGVSVGATRFGVVRAYPELGALFGDKKSFSNVELEDVSLQQQALGDFLAARLKGDNFSIARLSARKIKLNGPLPLPLLDADVTIAPDGSIGPATVRGPDGLLAKLLPRGAQVDFDVTASGFTLPMLTDVTLSTFAMKGTAGLDSMKIESWGGASLGGAISGNADIRWGGGTWTIEGALTVRGINAAVFAPALLSEGNAEGTGRFSMSAPEPTNFRERGRVEGSFLLNKGVLGSFDLSRALQTGGRQAGGRTAFTEMNGQGVYDRGAVSLRNVTFGAGAMNAGASADIAADGTLSGRIVADVKTSSQLLRATVNVGGTVKEPQVRN